MPTSKLGGLRAELHQAFRATLHLVMASTGFAFLLPHLLDASEGHGMVNGIFFFCGFCVFFLHHCLVFGLWGKRDPLNPAAE